MEDVKAKVKEDYFNRMKQAEIAEKYNISIHTIKQWIKRGGWAKEKKEGTTTKKVTKTQKSTRSTKSKKGTMKKTGTKNNKGSPLMKIVDGVERPLSVTHGAYEKIMYSTMTEDEIELISDSLRDNELEELYREKDILTVRELRYAKLIKQLRENETGLITVSAEKRKIETKHRGATPVDDYTEDTVETVGKTTYVFELIHKYEGELTRIQKQRAKVIETIHNIRRDREMVDIARQRFELERIKVLGVTDDVSQDENIKSFLQATASNFDNKKLFDDFNPDEYGKQAKEDKASTSNFDYDVDYEEVGKNNGKD